MEKRLIKKEALAGIAKKMAEEFLVWAPVKKKITCFLFRWKKMLSLSLLI